VALLFLLPPARILRQTKEQVDKAHVQTTYAEKTLAHYARLLRHIEGQGFETARLQGLHRLLELPEGKLASDAIHRLSYIIGQLNVRYNFFAILLNLGGLWELQWVFRLERWKSRLKTRLPQWFEAIAEFEALSSLGNLSCNNPEWAFPTLHNEARMEGEALGHPLLHRDKRVSNDIAVPTDGHIKLVTGSNMAGKSTFLRTVGLNIVLAMAGAPACARRLALPPLQVYTSMRTQDALHESTSSFYAELKRLKLIIEAVEAGADRQPPEPQAFFLLDEILKGTNSNDRHTGSKALIKQLIRSRGSGIIATHDLELGQLEASANGAVENLRIEVEIKDGKLYFDYKLKKGVSQSFNATLLMKQMGIKIEEEA
jgi:DNA mismatch repair ATPase MutS